MGKSKIPEEDIKAIENKESSIEQVAEKNNVTYSAVYQRVKKGKLAMSFKPDSGDTNPAPVDVPAEQGGILQKVDELTEEEIKEIFRGLWTFVDQMLKLIVSFSKDLEYEPLSDKDIDILLIGSSSQGHLAKYLKGNEVLGLMIFAGLTISVFGTRIKKKKKDKLSDIASQKPDLTTKPTILEQKAVENVDTSALEKVINDAMDKQDKEIVNNGDK